ncbi:hypothetical protein ACFWPU_19270 [Streptomyces sp. NPDC058471]|uniref:hypothetical protein n=1 Tax=Streptomyces sp. NPDC058471 TaxID=3346516 RepID=UPI003657CBA9
MPDWMPSWGTTALISIVTSLLTLIVAGRYVSPLLEVRNRRFQAKMQAREKFQADMLTVLSAATRLLATPIPAEATDTVRTALREERVRWRAQIDEATKRLADHFEQVAFSYSRSRQFSEAAVRYSGNARMVWISDRSEDRIERPEEHHPALPRAVLRQPDPPPSASPLRARVGTAPERTGGVVGLVTSNRHLGAVSRIS